LKFRKWEIDGANGEIKRQFVHINDRARHCRMHVGYKARGIGSIATGNVFRWQFQPVSAVGQFLDQFQRMRAHHCALYAQPRVFAATIVKDWVVKAEL
jgi:hypothetical protein